MQKTVQGIKYPVNLINNFKFLNMFTCLKAFNPVSAI